MFKLLKNVECYTPEHIGKLDILLASEKIAMMGENISPDLTDIENFDCEGFIACPGFIDQHIHFLGGGGEQGPESSISEINLGDIISAGVSTAVGLLGLDCIGKTITGLLAKARSLEAGGINTFIYTGYYGLPTVTLTGNVLNDIACVDKIIGAGEVAISDYRSSHPSLQDLKRISFETLTGGMLGGKAGVLHIHVGDGKTGLKPLTELIDKSEFPPEMFVPTHLNRNRVLFGQAVEFARSGGNIDLTAGENSEHGINVPDALKILFDEGINAGRITVSSDANGSMPGCGAGGKAAKGSVGMLMDDIRTSIIDKGLPFEYVIGTVTKNAAKRLKLYPGKGLLKPWSDADILVLGKSDMKVEKLFVRGRLLIDNGDITGSMHTT